MKILKRIIDYIKMTIIYGVFVTNRLSDEESMELDDVGRVIYVTKLMFNSRKISKDYYEQVVYSLDVRLKEIKKKYDILYKEGKKKGKK